MQDGFELLEEKVRKAAELVKRLRKENKSLEEDVTKSKWRVQEAEKRLAALEQQAEATQSNNSEARAQEIAALKEEREEVRRRVAKLVHVLEGLE